MRILPVVTFLLLPAFTAPSVSAADVQVPIDRQPDARASLVSPDGQPRGSVDILAASGGLLLQVTLTGFPPGTHALHIHEKGQCTPDFTAAGGHYNPTMAKHGLLNKDGHHLGDLPNFSVPANGTASFDVFVPGVTLDSGHMVSLLDGDGSAIVIHSGADDYRSDPAGKAGERIACGPIQPAA